MSGRTLLALSCLTSLPLESQTFRRRAGIYVQPQSQRWEFSDTLSHESLRITGLRQRSVAITLVMAMTPTWTMEVGGAVAEGVVETSGTHDPVLSGRTDVRVRVSGPVVSDKLLLTLGFNGPTGTVQLDDEQTNVLQVLGAPALRAGVLQVGTGLGGSGGLVFGQRLGAWSVALGASYEYRGRYSPVEALIAGARSVTQLNPAEAMHYSIGVDRLVGAHQVSALVTTDVFARDRLDFSSSGGDASTQFQLGQNWRVLWSADLAAPRFRELSVAFQRSSRGRFKDEEGLAITGSEGTVTDVQINSVLGSPRGVGLIARFDKRSDSGLAFDDTFVTAAMRATGFTIGLSLPFGVAFLEPFARLENGTLHLGPRSATVRSVTYGVRMAPR